MDPRHQHVSPFTWELAQSEYAELVFAPHDLQRVALEIFPEVTRLEQEAKSIMTEDRLILDFFLCSLSPEVARGLITRCMEHDLKFADENKALLDYVAPHLVD